jgi:hypothetical protein
MVSDVLAVYHLIRLSGIFLDIGLMCFLDDALAAMRAVLLIYYDSAKSAVLVRRLVLAPQLLAKDVA